MNVSRKKGRLSALVMDGIATQKIFQWKRLGKRPAGFSLPVVLYPAARILRNAQKLGKPLSRAKLYHISHLT
jgi:hypothetical protein